MFGVREKKPSISNLMTFPDFSGSISKFFGARATVARIFNFIKIELKMVGWKGIYAENHWKQEHRDAFHEKCFFFR